MRRKLLISLFLGLVAFMGVVSSALADKLICVSDERLRGQVDVNTCLIKGEQFAILDEHGAARILSPAEVTLMKALNPKAFEQPAYGVMYHREAPPLPKLPPLAVPKGN